MTSVTFPFEMSEGILRCRCPQRTFQKMGRRWQLLPVREGGHSPGLSKASEICQAHPSCLRDHHGGFEAGPEGRDEKPGGS